MVVDHKNLVANPVLAERFPWDRDPGEKGCWAVAWHKPPHLMTKQCTNSARPGRLTCGIHKHLEPRARMLKRHY